MWSADWSGEIDSHVGFVGVVSLAGAAEVKVRVLTAGPFVGWIDGAFWLDGPLRYPLSRPEYQEATLHLGPGDHALAFQVHHEGVTTRLQPDAPPFLACEVRLGDRLIPMDWKASELPGYRAHARRINPQLGWMEWCDTRNVPDNWQRKAPDGWHGPRMTQPPFAEARPPSIASPHAVLHSLVPVQEGKLADVFGYEGDDPSARFYLRDLEPRELPPDGVWRRYDLGRVRLGRPRITLDAPAGAVVEFGMSEALERARVSPWINLSAGMSCNLDRYVARGGEQTFEPLTPKGGRFLEVHVTTPPDQVRFVVEEFRERLYHGGPEGSFNSPDGLLNQIWAVGVETYRACTEDALTDNPSRERGQWTGDVVTVGMGISASAFSDMRLVRRGLVQSAECARADGLVAGLCPGGCEYLSTYAAQWISACLHYWELTGDRDLLREMLPNARRNVAAFEAAISDEGVADRLGWGFVDWGYVRNEGPTDMGLNLHVLGALRDMAKWCELVDATDAERLLALARRLESTVRRWFETHPKWSEIGYHRAVLGLRLGLLQNREGEAIDFIKAHMLECFPNDPSAPRLSHPSASQPRLITPYFGHYALAELWERGEGAFALDQYRTCWGWALADGRTTWLEVFDTRWSHCHQWAGCPTWQLSRYALGIRPRMDLGPRVFEFDPRPCSLPWASGAFPAAEGEIQVRWEKSGSVRQVRVESQSPFRLRHAAGEADVVGALEFTLPM